MSELDGKTLIDPKKGLKNIAIGELAAALDEMNDAGGFSSMELDEAALRALMAISGEQQGYGRRSS